MKNKFIISIDGDYDSDSDASFFISGFKEQFRELGYNYKIYNINSSISIEDNLSTLNHIKDELEKDDSKLIIFIVGGIAEVIIESFLRNKKVLETTVDMSEISRVYSQLTQKIANINVLLIKESNEISSMFEKLDSMNISLGFNYENIYVQNKSLISINNEIVEIINKKGGNIRPISI
jgi:hypothetical protein